MKKLTLPLVLAFAALSALSAAQVAGPTGGAPVTPPTHAKRGNAMQKQREMLEKLNLTTDQKTKIDALLEKNKEDMKALRKANKGSTDKEAMRAKQRDMRKALMTSIGEVLTPDQMAKLKELQKEARKESRKEKNAPANP